MPQFLASDSAADTIAALGKALDLLDVGVAVLDRLRARVITRRFAEVWALPDGAAPTLRELTEVVQRFHAGDPTADRATAADRLEAAVRAGAIPSAELRLADGQRRLLRCLVRGDGGRLLTCAAPVS